MRSLIKFLFITLGLPLLVCLWGGTQVYRLPGSLAVLKQNAAEVTEGINKLSRLKAEHGGSHTLSVSRNGLASSMTVDQLLSRYQTGQDSLQWRIRLEQAEILTAYGALALGAIATLVAIFILLRIRGMGRRALVSRQALLSNFSVGAPQLPWLSLAFALPLYLGTACALVFEANGYFRYGGGRLVMAALLLAVVLLVLGADLIRKMIKTARSTFKAEPIEVMGKSISEQEAPKLWSFVRDVARKLDTKMPDKILVGLNEGFFVTEHAVELTGGEILAAGRKLYLPLPYMAFMDKAQTEAVIGHEFGHFLGEDTEYSLHFSPVYASALNNLLVLRGKAGEGGQVVGLLTEYFIHTFDAAVKHWSRLRELAADQVGAKAASPQASALALLRISALAPRVNEALELCWRRGAEVEGGVLAQLRRLVTEKGLNDPQSDLAQSLPHPVDTHPPTRQRIEALQIEVTPQLLAQAIAPQPSSLLYELGLDQLTREVPAESATSDAEQPVLSTALEQQFSDVARDQRQQRIDFLTPIAALGKETLPVFRAALGTIAGFVIAFSLLGIGMIVGFADMGTLVALAQTPGGLAVVSLVLLGLGFDVWKRLKAKPMFTLTADSLIFGEAAVTVAWTAVTNISVSVQSAYGIPLNVTVCFTLGDDLAPPSRKLGPGVRYWKKQKWIRVVVSRFRGMSAKSFNEQLNNHWRGGLARHELASYGIVA